MHTLQQSEAVLTLARSALAQSEASLQDELGALKLKEASASAANASLTSETAMLQAELRRLQAEHERVQARPRPPRRPLLALRSSPSLALPSSPSLDLRSSSSLALPSSPSLGCRARAQAEAATRGAALEARDAELAEERLLSTRLAEQLKEAREHAVASFQAGADGEHERVDGELERLQRTLVEEQRLNAKLAEQLREAREHGLELQSNPSEGSKQVSPSMSRAFSPELARLSSPYAAGTAPADEGAVSSDANRATSPDFMPDGRAIDSWYSNEAAGRRSILYQPVAAVPVTVAPAAARPPVPAPPPAPAPPPVSKAEAALQAEASALMSQLAVARTEGVGGGGGYERLHARVTELEGRLRAAEAEAVESKRAASEHAEARRQSERLARDGASQVSTTLPLIHSLTARPPPHSPLPSGCPVPPSSFTAARERGAAARGRGRQAPDGGEGAW